VKDATVDIVWSAVPAVANGDESRARKANAATPRADDTRDRDQRHGQETDWHARRDAGFEMHLPRAIESVIARA
jgi:hypothetical protein